MWRDRGLAGVRAGDAGDVAAGGPGGASARRLASTRSSPTSTGFAPSSTSAGSGCPTVADKNYDLLYPLLDLVTTLDPRFIVAYRFGAIFLSEQRAGRTRTAPIWRSRCCERGVEASARRGGSTRTTSASSTTGSHRDYPSGRRVVRARQPKCRVRRSGCRSTAATMLPRGGDRESARAALAAAVTTAPRSTSLQETRARSACAQLDAMDAIDQLNDDRVALSKRGTGGSRATWQELIAARVLRGVPRRSDRRAVRARSASTQDVRLVETVAAVAAADGPGVVRAVMPRPRSSCLTAVLGLVRRQLSQRLHLPAAARRVAGLSAVALSALRQRLALVRQHSGRQLARAPRPLPAVRRADLDPVPDRRSSSPRWSRCSSCASRRRARCSPAGSCSAPS